MSKLVVTASLACALVLAHCWLAAQAAALVGSYDLNPIGISLLVEANSTGDQQPGAGDGDAERDYTNRQDYVKRASSRQEAANDYGPIRVVPMSSQELRRKIRLDQVLEALSASISATTKAPSILRSGRTYPSAPVSELQQRQQQFAARPLAAELGPLAALAPGRLAGPGRPEPDQWARAAAEPGANSIRPIMSVPLAAASHPKSRKSTGSGLVGLWFAGPNSNSKPLAAGSGAAPPFYSSQQAGRKLPSLPAGPPEPGEPAAGLAGSLQRHQQQHRDQQQQHHRSGTEEVALHTPIHSYSASDNEWKRVENSRGRDWNNLRGMWGKRAISERYTNLDDFKDMLQAEAREPGPPQTGDQGLAAGAAGADDDNDDADDDQLARRLSRFNEQLDQLLQHHHHQQQQQQQQQQRQFKQAPRQTMAM